MAFPIFSNQLDERPAPATPSSIRDSLAGLSLDVVVRIIVSGVLLLAAVLKLDDLAFVRQPPSAALPPIVALPLALLEVGLACWLLSGYRRELSRRVAVVAFVLFSCISLYHAMAESRACGCFGGVPISPWRVFVLDLCVVVALGLTFDGRANPTRRHVWRHAMAPAATLIVGVITFDIAHARSNIVTLLDGGHIRHRGRTVVLDPSHWVGKPFPLLSRIDIGAQLAVGEWTVLLYRDQCPKCHDEIDRLRRRGRSSESPVGGRSFALVAVPPYSEASPNQMNDVFRHGRMDDGAQYWVETPVTVSLRNGMVTTIRLAREHDASPTAADEDY